ncbi:transcription-repair coupling factor [Desulfococcaceae bacterium HSG7]|nr:transcription-repair coupling factor [Desulfococcaceae bacterium HSG7]
MIEAETEFSETTTDTMIGHIHSRSGAFHCTGISGSERAYLVSKIYQKHKRPLTVITATSKDAERFKENLEFFLPSGASPVCVFPPYNILPFKQLAYHSETAARRIRILHQLTEDVRPPILVTSISAFVQKMAPKKIMQQYSELIMAGEETDRDQLIRKLVEGGYTRAAIVEEPGDYCVRGGILDVFSPLYKHPLRIEFFGDLVESLRFFSVTTQRKKGDFQEAVIVPAREAILKRNNLEHFIRRVKKQAAELDLSGDKVREIIERIKKEGLFQGIEGLISLLYDKLDILSDYLPDNTLLVLSEPRNIANTADKEWEQATKNFITARNDGRLCVPPQDLYLKWSQAQKMLNSLRPLSFHALAVSSGDPAMFEDSFDFNVQDNTALSTRAHNYRENQELFKPLVKKIREYQENRFTVCLACGTKSRADSLKSMLTPYGLSMRISNGFGELNLNRILNPDVVYICTGQVSSGFVWPLESLAIITEEEIFGVRRKRRKTVSRRVHTELITFGDMRTGDLVVHAEHGIGQYGGLTKLTLTGAAHDFLLISYRNNDKLYLPVDRISMVSKYMGVDGVAPVLDKMGGKSWERIKKRVKESVAQIANDLLKLYAKRRINKGWRFSPPDRNYSEFEHGFPYEETADQQKAINDVLNDMEKSTPMDRLICGDVGYGKTEVALRAAFKAVNDNKQAAMLVPTTVLAEQHYATFAERFERYPVKVACLNRFRTLKEQREILKCLKNGTTDIVIGTHRLIQKDVVFNDLGLLVLDEEQRFGVTHKEKLKKFKSTVDVLALTATPIPRTLHMSLVGVRDISIISTPPEQRQAIITYISEFDDAIIASAVRKELKRKGQIFFIHNNIRTIWAIAERLQKLVPEVRLDVAHGRLSEKELEKVMMRFIHKEIDMLVCTTIVESGLDIPNANTILINRADRFGLAQMYQLRGRVGRAEEQAYAYLFIPHESILTRDAQKRLKVLMEYSDLGSGFQIAMSDLKIRGGGSILGASQSGHIAAVGYDMFLKLMENAVAELKGEPIQEDLEPEINVFMACLLPETYIPDIDQRLTAYRRLARMKTLDKIAEFKSELQDRFGPLPVEASNLLMKIMLKVLAIRAGVKRLDLTEGWLVLSFSEAHQKNPLGIIELVSRKNKKCTFTADHIFKTQLAKKNLKGLMIQAKNILQEIYQCVNL